MTWGCSPDLCKLQPINEMNKNLSEIYGGLNAALDAKSHIQHDIQHFDNCTKQHVHGPALLGDCKDFYFDAGSKSLYLCQLSPHFPNMRRIVNMVYAYC